MARIGSRLTILGLQGIPTYPHGTPAARVRDDVDAALREGAVGIELFGGHYPNTPDISAQAIAEGDSAGCYVAFHLGTAANGSNLDGMREASGPAGLKTHGTHECDAAPGGHARR